MCNFNLMLSCSLTVVIKMYLLCHFRVTWVASYTGVWAYPILEVLDNVSRAIFLGSCAGAMLGLYFVGEKFQKWRWGQYKTPKRIQHF